MFNYILPTRTAFPPTTDSTSIRNPEFGSLNLNIPFRAYRGVFAGDKEYDGSEECANEKRFNVEGFHAPHVTALNPNGETESPQPLLFDRLINVVVFCFVPVEEIFFIKENLYLNWRCPIATPFSGKPKGGTILQNYAAGSIGFCLFMNQTVFVHKFNVS